MLHDIWLLSTISRRIFTDKAREDLNKRVKIWAIIIIAVIFGELILLGII